MKSLPTYINEKLILNVTYTIVPKTKDELVKVILKHFKSHNGDLNDIYVYELDKEDFYCLFYDLRDEIEKNNITEINISDWNLTELYYDEYHNRGMFDSCMTLETIILPDCLEVIGKYAFHSCRKLDNINIPDSVTSIGDGAFYDCYSLTNVVIPDSISSIDDYAFTKCYNLHSVIIPNSVTSIGNYAFYMCDGLTSVTIGNSVANMGVKAFFGCGHLTITVPNEQIKEIVKTGVFRSKIEIK